MFANPTALLYDTLPPPINTLDDILAVVFTGPSEALPEDLKRSPFYVRRKAIFDALTWLKLNHPDYSDLDMQKTVDNLSLYPEGGIPVNMDYQFAESNKIPEATGLDNTEFEDGTASGPCPFRVHGLTEKQVTHMGLDEMKIHALQFINTGGNALQIEHGSQMESIYNNVQLYPKMFPWLFPYGAGGVGTSSLSESEHLKHLLLYHDKRFQVDPEFSLIAFSHHSIKSSTTGSHILTHDQ
ncbi:hypothetical protein BDP27DRAFT_1221489 [Rhodocollybia butyracea]|uniref:DUF6570 domain-containing protein n=1 Tax=Rhodocollybia butyracea TaxID=206335 RepID=A0A9P5PVK9_9AGAR|nr:hypothetical protein BDP27DRAFT_1221489 [Rhodocollybia butyracea]